MIATLAAIPLIVVFRRSADGEANQPVMAE
jgi:hypothetical protein